MFCRNFLYLNANSVDPDQTPRSAASDLGLHCLPMSLLWDARLKWVKKKTEKQSLEFIITSFIYTKLFYL